MIYFDTNPNIAVIVWIDGSYAGVIMPNSDMSKHNEIISKVVEDHLCADEVIVTGLWEFRIDKGEENANVNVHIYQDEEDRYEDIELTTVTLY